MIPRLETERLALRAWNADDFDTLAQFYADPVVMKFLGGAMERTDAWRALAGAIGHWGLRGYGNLGGGAQSRPRPDRPRRAHPSGRLAGAGTRLDAGAAYWGRGYAAEAAAAALDYAFLTQAVDRMISLIDPQNTASQAVAVRIGETKGELRKLRTGGKEFDVDVWSIARGEWQRRRAAA